MALQPSVRSGLETILIDMVEATPETLEGYGKLIDDPADCDIEIVVWPAQGRRAVDSGTGNAGGTTEGVFRFWWEEGVFKGENEAVSDNYILGWSHPPGASEPRQNEPRESAYMWHANYHPDGGQLFFPLDKTAFVAPLALPGDDVRPESFTAFYCDGSQGLYIHPKVWHEALFLFDDSGRFFDKQSKVHARISVDFPQEFGCLLEVPLVIPWSLLSRPEG